MSDFVMQILLCALEYVVILTEFRTCAILK